MGEPNQYRKLRPDESADAHIERELQAATIDRLTRENRTLKAALRTAGRLLKPYLGEDDSSQRR